MIRLGILGVDTSHPAAYSSFFNGFTPDLKEAYGQFGEEPQPIPGVHVEAIWGAQEDRLEKLVKDFSIPFVGQKPEDLLGKADAVLVCARSGADHLQLARPFLEAKVPTFVDKPLADDIADAEEIIRLAERHKTPMSSSSALRFSIELDPLKALLKEKGQVWGGCGMGPSTYSTDSTRYAIHSVEGIISLVGTGVESVLSVGTDSNQVVRLMYGDGRVVLVITGNAYYSYDYIVWGQDWRAAATVKNYYQFYRRTMEAFLEMVRSGQPPIPHEETLEVVKIVLAAEKSIATGEEVAL